MPIISFLSVPFFFVCIYPTDTRWLVTNAQSKQRKRISFPKLNYLRLHVWLLLFTMLLYSASPAPAPPFLHLSLLFVWMLAKMFFMSMHAYFYLLSLYTYLYVYSLKLLCKRCRRCTCVCLRVASKSKFVHIN